MANTKVTKAVLADDAVGLAQLDISNDPSDGQALTAVAVSDGYNLTWANNTVSGISSSADATAITINSSEEVSINTTTTFSNPLTTNQSGGSAGALRNQIAMTHTGASNAYHIKTVRAAATDEPSGIAFVDNTTTRLQIHENGNTSIGDNHPNTHALTVADQNNRTMDGNATGQFRIQGAGYSSAFAMDASALYIYHNSAYRDIVFGINETETLKINQGGEITAPQHPVFDVSTTATGGLTGVITYNTVYVNVGSHYSTSNGRFTAPVAGTYMFTTQFIRNANGAVARRRFIKNGGTTGVHGNRHFRSDSVGSYGDNGALIVVITLAANDYIQVDHYAGNSHGGTPYEQFTGFLIG